MEEDLTLFEASLSHCATLFSSKFFLFLFFVAWLSAPDMHTEWCHDADPCPGIRNLNQVLKVGETKDGRHVMKKVMQEVQAAGA